MTREPVAIAAGIQAAIIAVINVANAFNLITITDAQLSTLNASLAIVLPLLFALVVRNSVTPTASPQLPEGTTVTTTANGQTTGSTTV